MYYIDSITIDGTHFVWFKNNPRSEKEAGRLLTVLLKTKLILSGEVKKFA